MWNWTSLLLLLTIAVQIVVPAPQRFARHHHGGGGGRPPYNPGIVLTSLNQVSFYYDIETPCENLICNCQAGHRSTRAPAVEDTTRATPATTRAPGEEADRPTTPGAKEQA